MDMRVVCIMHGMMRMRQSAALRVCRMIQGAKDQQVQAEHVEEEKRPAKGRAEDDAGRAQGDLVGQGELCILALTLCLAELGKGAEAGLVELA
eukprot:CAMPEP_0113951788 /NCGR_PEP_ID=MMETSP1339-20121228/87887_1 /TAXON_ID=94617 /ORGANISM="Fibrocapsa japonica" /LENGTH=92 /DNA_ID=CAMNT_0000960151 /DNA_START=147 /DNA_END=421 /DNA_ORIENTATION=+ /assembly_acc=CAM_ASM_000762